MSDESDTYELAGTLKNARYWHRKAEEYRAERDAWKGRFEGAAAIYADAADERDALREELEDAKAGRKEWEHLWKQADEELERVRRERDLTRGVAKATTDRLRIENERLRHVIGLWLRDGFEPDEAKAALSTPEETETREEFFERNETET